MKGQKPLPTNLKILRGTNRKKDTIEPAPEAAIPSCPDHLDKCAKGEWRRISKELHGLGLLTRIDRAALACYCQNYSRWVDAEKQIRAQGVVVKSPNGYPIQNPYLSIANEAMRQMKAFLTEFGMTPSSRTRVGVKDKPKTQGVLKRNRA